MMKFISILSTYVCFCASPLYAQYTLPIVEVGNQVWVAWNAEIVTFRNGDTIPQAKSKEEFIAANTSEQPAWCYYENDQNNGEKYGKLYNWYAVNDSRGIAPIGFRVANDDDWTKLIDFAGGELVAGGHLRSKEGWIDDLYGENTYGFYALACGLRTSGGIFFGIQKLGYYWTATEFDKDNANYLIIASTNNIVVRSQYSKGYAFGVRFIKE